ncbi:MAG: hypothetical protein ACFCUQ_07030 [Kiloniellales bacterium]
MPQQDLSGMYEDELVDQPAALPAASQAASREVPLPRPRPEQLALAAQSQDGDVPPNGSATLPINRLVGLDFEGTRALLGQPELDEVQPPALVWIYSGTGCVLRVFFYREVEATTYRALTYEVRGGEDTAAFRDRCFTGLVRNKAKPTG